MGTYLLKRIARKAVRTLFPSKRLTVPQIGNLPKEKWEELLVRNVRKTFPYPGTVYLQPTEACNLHCRMCEAGTVYGTGRARFLDNELFERVVGQIKGKPVCLALTGGGEGLLHKEFFSMMERARRVGVDSIFFDTNGTLLNEDRARRCVEIPANHVSVSIDAVRPETYKMIRGVDKLETVEGNTMGLIEAKKKSGAALPLISVSFVLQDVNRDELQPFIDKWLPHVDSVIINNVHHEDKYPMKNFVPEYRPCGYAWQAMHILVDGTIVPCNRCAERKNFAMGNAYRDGLRDVWLGPEYQKMRAELVRGELEGNPRCSGCEVWMAFASREESQDDRLITTSPTGKVIAGKKC